MKNKIFRIKTKWHRKKKGYHWEGKVMKDKELIRDSINDFYRLQK